MSEFDLIAKIAQRVTPRRDVLTGIGDDCAILAPPVGQHLAVSTDTLVADVHFFAHTEPYLIGYKSLAVNLSDLAAMGAKPLWYTLALTLPSPDHAFALELTRGMHTLSVEHDIALIGGDTTRGPLAITITVIGALPAGTDAYSVALKRNGAQIGDGVYVSGTLGDAAGALKLRLAKLAEPPWLAQRLDQPTPRVALGLALHGIASSAIDVSDGLIADLTHICERSKCSALLHVDRLPISHELVIALGLSAAQECALSGGDDYELCFTAAPEHHAALVRLGASLNVQITRIGTIGLRLGLADAVCVQDALGAPMVIARRGYEHFV
jgi:thiamine-monophosphate kinase